MKEPRKVIKSSRVLSTESKRWLTHWLYQDHSYRNKLIVDAVKTPSIIQWADPYYSEVLWEEISDKIKSIKA